MNIIDFIEKLKNISNIDFVKNLEKNILEWKIDNKTILELENLIEKYFDNYLIEDNKVYTTFYKIWTDFKNEVFHSINGMTMNERLYYFDLFDRFDQSNNSKKEIIYLKLLAKK